MLGLGICFCDLPEFLRICECACPEFGGVFEVVVALVLRFYIFIATTICFAINASVHVS